MILQEKHKHFAVKCYARFMSRREVTEAFIEEFPNDLPKPPPKPEPPIQNDELDTKQKQKKDQHFSDKINRIRSQYRYTYGDEANQKFEEDTQEILDQIERAYQQEIEYQRNEKYNQMLQEHQELVEQHWKDVKAAISNQLCRYNIEHRQFPQKYRTIFERTRNEYLLEFRFKIENDDTFMKEAEMLYGYVRCQVYSKSNPNAATANLAFRILKALNDNKKS